MAMRTKEVGLKPHGKPYQSGPMEGQPDHAMLSSGPPKDDLGHVIHPIVVVELTMLKSFWSQRSF